jgi:hypothetical protein
MIVPDPINILLCLEWYQSKGIHAYPRKDRIYIIIGSEMSCDEHHIEVSLDEILRRAKEQEVCLNTPRICRVRQDIIDEGLLIAVVPLDGIGTDIKHIGEGEYPYRWRDGLIEVLVDKAWYLADSVDFEFDTP